MRYYYELGAVRWLRHCFRDAAAKVLPEKTFFVILEMAHDIKRAREVA